MIGPGKYDYLLTDALKNADAKQGLLFIYDGRDGPGFTVQATIELNANLPLILRVIANQIEKDLVMLKNIDSQNQN